MALLLAQTLATTSAGNRLRVQGIRYLYLLKKRWWVILLLLSLGLCIGAWTAMQQPPAWLSTGRLMVSGQLRIGESAAAYSEELVNFFGTQIELMQSGEVFRGAEIRVQAMHPDLPREQVKVVVGQLPKAAIFELRVYGKSPAYAQAYVDACMDEYIAKKKEMRKDKQQGAAVAIQDELVRLEKDMQNEEEEMHTFQKENNIGFLKEDGNSAANYLSLLSRQMAEMKTEFDLLKLLDLDQNLDRGPSATGTGEKMMGRADSL